MTPIANWFQCVTTFSFADSLRDASSQNRRSRGNRAVWIGLAIACVCVAITDPGHVTYTWKRQRIRHVEIAPEKLGTKPIVDSSWPSDVN